MKLSTPVRLAAPILQAFAFHSHKISSTSALAAMTPPEGSRSYSSADPNTVSTTEGTCTTAESSSFLEKARSLQLPTREQVLQRDRSVHAFWDGNDILLEKAWKEWQASDEVALSLPKLDSSLIHPKLRTAVEHIWSSVEAGDMDQVEAQEKLLKELFQEVAPGVYGIQFFDMEKIHIIRRWFDAGANAGIPIRPPYGIVLNRKGFMIDPRSVGYWAAPDFQSFYKDVLIDSYIRPISRLIFPGSIIATDDAASFAFSIQYQVGGDESIRHHTDASTITFNINLDEKKSWTGSSLYFWETLNGGKRFTVEWAPGMAMMHLGRTLHAALPIESGTRSNIVVWTMPKDGGRGYGGPLTVEDGKYPAEYQLSREERWTKPIGTTEKPFDRWTPF